MSPGDERSLEEALLRFRRAALLRAARREHWNLDGLDIDQLLRRLDDRAVLAAVLSHDRRVRREETSLWRRLWTRWHSRN